MIRTVITPGDEKISIDLPRDYVGKRVEVIAFTIEETQKNDVIATHIASEDVLAKDWSNSSEDQAWSSL